MPYTKSDLANIIAIAEQDEANPEIASNLTKRAQKALVYRDCSLHITKRDRDFLASHYDADMDDDAKETLDRILQGRGE